MRPRQTTELEFSRPIPLDEIDPEGLQVELEAGPEERQRLASRFDLLDLEELVASLSVTRAASGIPIRVTGRFRGRVTQQCVVSLEPVESVIEDTIDVEFGPSGGADLGHDFAHDEVEPPEPLEDDRIDLGELVVQHLAVCLDPYPRKEGAGPPAWQDPAKSATDSTVDNPFAVLASWHKKRK